MKEELNSQTTGAQNQMGIPGWDIAQFNILIKLPLVFS